MSSDIDLYNKIIEECMAFLFITRDSDLQKDACDKLDSLMRDIMVSKNAAIILEDDNLANLFLGFECVCMALRFELCMWLYLKKSEPEKAWDCLVTAQTAAEAAASALTQTEDSQAA
ncbi:hypothetical protein [Telmatospirillum siberiense]|uniref:Uncharacterized protein n=1 Tax=Telmatospirillum siberiense TaxID=382514 RepID=A0A2N3PS04_9PROT|nr:hypothetical protein [Telmatospirillum siberiense]PKU23191.1 hypothetical protein CWS72_17305 [Telmatospirillum siberiense]